MTISKYVSEFLRLYANIEIDTNHVQDGADKFGLFKSPSREFTRLNDGSAIITEYFQFFAFQTSIGEYERKEDDEWLEAFTYWVDDYPFRSEYPYIDGNRTVIEITATGNPTPFEDNNRGIMYQITLSIKYEREATPGQI